VKGDEDEIDDKEACRGFCKVGEDDIGVTCFVVAGGNEVVVMVGIAVVVVVFVFLIVGEEGEWGGEEE